MRDADVSGLPIVPGFPDYCYDTGWNIYRRTPALGTYVGRPSRPFVNREGRVAWTLKRNGRQGTLFRAALVCAHFHGPRPSGMYALHGNGDPSDDRRENLRWGTHKDNMQDRVRHGRHPMLSGSRHGRATLTEDAVRLIRSSAAKHTELAKLYGVHPTTIGHVRNRMIWKDVS